MAISKTRSVRAELTVCDGTDYLFPERGLPGFTTRTANNGICFSGGGSRALSAEWGQLRALTALGLIPGTRYISCVSGGSWASGAFTYFKTPGDDAAFLGAEVSDGRRSAWSLADWRASVERDSLGWAATRPFKKALGRWLERGPRDEAWQRAVGEIFYAPFGLYDPEAKDFFSLDDATVAAILEANPDAGWAASDFHTARPDRPYLIVNGTMLWPTEFFHHTNKMLIQFTPLYAGNPYLLKVEEKLLLERHATREVGGGFVGNPGFGSVGPATRPEIRPPGSGLVTMPDPSYPWSLWRASGVSSAAYGADVSRLDPKLIPSEVYFSPPFAGHDPANAYRISDGGNLENYGLLSLLQRRVERIVVFINSPKAIARAKDGSIEIDGNLPPLFGLPSKAMPNNQVFDRELFEPLAEALLAAQNAGGLVSAKGTYPVLSNDWHGTNPYEVEILWIYNGLVSSWVDRLSSEVRDLVVEGHTTARGPLRDFPNYKTIGEDPLDLVEMTPEQVALLADMHDWSLRRDPDDLRRFLAPPA